MNRQNVSFQEFVSDIVGFNAVLVGEILVKAICIDPIENVWEVQNIFNKIEQNQYQLLSDVKTFIVPDSRRFQSQNPYDSALFVIDPRNKRRHYQFKMHKLNL